MNADIYDWKAFIFKPDDATSSSTVDSIDDVLLPGEYVSLHNPVQYGNQFYYSCRIIKCSANYCFVQVAAYPDQLPLELPTINAPINRSYISYPTDIILTNIGTTININDIKSIIIIVSKEEIEEGVLGALATIKNVFLLRCQYNARISKLS
jgi:hypothetical protein